MYNRKTNQGKQQHSQSNQPEDLPTLYSILFTKQHSTKLSMKETTMKLVLSNSSGYVIPKPSQSARPNSEIESTISASLKPSPSSLPKPKNPPRYKPRRRSKRKRLKDHETGLAKFFDPRIDVYDPSATNRTPSKANQK